MLNACYSLDRKYILSSSYDRTIREWDCNTKTCIQIKTIDTKNDLANFVYNGTYHKNICSIMSNNMIGLRETNFSINDNASLDVISSTSSTSILKTEGVDVLEIDRDTGICLRTLRGHKHNALLAAYSPTGDRVICVYDDGSIKEWIFKYHVCNCVIKEKTDNVVAISYSKDGHQVIIVYRDGTVNEWDHITGTCTRSYIDKYREVNPSISVYGLYRLSASKNDIVEDNIVTNECYKRYTGYLLD